MEVSAPQLPSTLMRLERDELLDVVRILRVTLPNEGRAMSMDARPVELLELDQPSRGRETGPSAGPKRVLQETCSQALASLSRCEICISLDEPLTLEPAIYALTFQCSFEMALDRSCHSTEPVTRIKCRS